MNINEYQNIDYQNYHETKSHTAEDFPYITYLCSIPLDFSYVPLHWHSEAELIVIQKGKGYVSVDFQKQLVTAGDIVFIRPGQLHMIEQSGTHSMEYENIIFKPSLLISGAHDLCSLRYLTPLMDGVISSETFLTQAVSFYPEAENCIRRIDSYCSARPDGYQLAVKGLLFEFFFLLVSHQQEQKAFDLPQAKSLEKIKTILKYVEEHYSEPISIDDMAALTYYSKSHFMKFFKTHMGTGFIEYLNDYRLTMAERLLRSTAEPILEIAGKTGFENLSYFNRIFKRKYGISPGRYRKQTGYE